jgi:hypothetical protein
MFPRLRLGALALALAALLAPGAADAGCLMAGTWASCLQTQDLPSRPAPLVQLALSSASAPSPLAAVGDVLPRGAYSLILNAEYYGLPPVADGWVYLRVGPDAFRVDWHSHQVLERVTDEAAPNF